MLAETLHGGLQWLWMFLFTSWLPIGLSLAALVLHVRRRASPATPPEPGRALGLAEAFAGITWAFLFTETLTPRRIPLFDYGAPALALLCLLVLPILGALAWRQRHELLATRGTWPLCAVSLPLLVLSLVPGIFLLWFYAAMLYSDR